MAKFIVTLVIETQAKKPEPKKRVREWVQTALDHNPNGWPSFFVKKARVRSVDLD